MRANGLFCQIFLFVLRSACMVCYTIQFKGFSVAISVNTSFSVKQIVFYLVQSIKSSIFVLKKRATQKASGVALHR